MVDKIKLNSFKLSVNPYEAVKESVGFRRKKRQSKKRNWYEEKATTQLYWNELVYFHTGRGI